MSATESTAIVEKRAKPNLFQRIKAQNLLSFGPEGIDLELGPLNVLIGPNGSGKSNLVELFGLLQAAPRDISSPIQSGGGIHHWIWKGNPSATAVVEAQVFSPFGPNPFVHALVFTSVDQTFRLINEQLYQEVEDHVEFIFQHSEEGRAAIRASGIEGKPYQFFDVSRTNSMLSQLRGPGIFTEFEYLSHAYTALRLYRDWTFGTNAVFRQPQRADIPRAPLNEDFSNLGMFLNRMEQYPQAYGALKEKLQDLYEGLEHLTLNFDGSTVQVYFHEGKTAIPAVRLSDGSLRYLCLLAILLDPEPPPFIVLEEPELGMHPDLIPKIADLLVDASTRTQLVVTTHSDILVSAFTQNPERLIVCEKHEGQTEMHRLDSAELEDWLKDYRSDETQLGEMWIDGEIGGTRW